MGTELEKNILDFFLSLGMNLQTEISLLKIEKYNIFFHLGYRTEKLQAIMPLPVNPMYLFSLRFLRHHASYIKCSNNQTIHFH